MKRKMLVDVRLEPNKGDRAQVMAVGDVHYGSANCDVERFKATLEECVKKRIYVIGMGDMLEMSTLGSVGDLFSQDPDPQGQMDEMIEMLQPLADEGLLIGLHDGNHCFRATKATSLIPTMMMARILQVPYLDHSAMHIWRVGKEVYTTYSTHGSSGARLPWSKIKSALDCWRFVDSEIVLYAHLHGLDHMTQLYFRVNRSKKTMEQATRHAILTGSYLRYIGSYAERKNLPPVQMGSPLISLYGDEHKIHVSL